MTSAAFDPYATLAPASPVRFLYALNPLAKLAAPVPAMIALVFVRDLATPLVFVAISYAVVLVGARLTGRLAAVMFLGVPVAVAVVGFGFSVWVDSALVEATPAVLRIGDGVLYSGALELGFATALRLAAIVALALIGGVTTTGPDLVRATVQQLRVPYRIGYTALAAFRFVPRFAYELDVIRAAHRVRGHHGGAGPFSRAARAIGYIVPLLAGAIRHAERVALAMDARAFGAYPTRTERYLVPFRPRDIVFIALFWIVSAAVLWLFFPWQLG
ncbi:energy-coupling factor transporter transmembrane component T [Microbacterium rhizomatis]|uniref:Energy-coupling factor transporter transmembrane protein EcfT n=1 Tax=Microbacterium rhizomatis TaxID=1631477 RepID=A0A5J5J0Q6_9MICO|nr:energy-coupling factor transporter transmembrane component T [Microbacterium rhizomatis]KAA9106439.1 energy-coupling factor transporter transmembrane protein EcfT [Microbacterium rhizomatis]